MNISNPCIPPRHVITPYTYTSLAWFSWYCYRGTVTLLHCYTVTLLHCYTVTIYQMELTLLGSPLPSRKQTTCASRGGGGCIVLLHITRCTCDPSHFTLGTTVRWLCLKSCVLMLNNMVSKPLAYWPCTDHSCIDQPPNVYYSQHSQPRWLSGLKCRHVPSLMIARRSLCPEKLGSNPGQGSKGINFSGWHGLDMSVTVTKRR